MRSIGIIALNTYREIIRDRILYGLFVFATLLMGLSLVLGQLSFAEQVRISINMGLTAIHVSAVVISIFIGSSLVRREIEKKTVFTLLVRPLSRFEFLLGKFFGLLLVLAVVLSLLALVLGLLFLGLGADLDLIFVGAIWGIFVEACLLLAVSLLISCFATPMMVVPLVTGIFLIGHWKSSLAYFAEKSSSALVSTIQTLVHWTLPHLESLNWRENVIYGDIIPLSEISTATLSAFLWCAGFILISTFILNRRDFD